MLLLTYVKCAQIRFSANAPLSSSVAACVNSTGVSARRLHIDIETKSVNATEPDSASPNTTPSGTPSANTNTGRPSDTSLITSGTGNATSAQSNLGLAIGAGVGVPLGVIGFGALLFLFWRERRKPVMSQHSSGQDNRFDNRSELKSDSTNQRQGMMQHAHWPETSSPSQLDGKRLHEMDAPK